MLITIIFIYIYIYSCNFLTHLAFLATADFVPTGNHLKPIKWKGMKAVQPSTMSQDTEFSIYSQSSQNFTRWLPHLTHKCRKTSVKHLFARALPTLCLSSFHSDTVNKFHPAFSWTSLVLCPCSEQHLFCQRANSYSPFSAIYMYESFYNYFRIIHSHVHFPLTAFFSPVLGEQNWHRNIKAVGRPHPMTQHGCLAP